MNRVIVGLGSNIDPGQNIQKAREILAQKYRVLAESRFGTTKPIGRTAQADFLNGTVLIETEQTIGQLKTALNRIEADMGRVQADNPSGPRIIDLDIVVWNETIIDQDFYKRGYLQQSVLELVPDLKY